MMNEVNLLPDSWTTATVAEIGAVITGNTPSTQNQDNYGGFIPFVKPPQLMDSQIENTKEYLSEQGVKFSRVLPPLSVLVSCIGNLGKTGINKIPVAFNQQINAIVPSGGISAAYLFYQAQSHSFRCQLESKATATTISIVNKGNFETVILNIAPFNEQHRIVAKIEELFSELDKGIENLKTAQAQLKVYRQALLKHAFEGKLTAQWRAERHAKQSVAPAKAGAQPLNDMDSRPTPSRGLALRGNDKVGDGNDKPLETADTLLKRIQQERAQRYQQQLADWEASGKQGSKPKPPKTLLPLTAEELAKLPELPEGWGWVKSGELFESVTSGSRGWAEYYADSGAIFIRITNLDFDSLKLDLSPKKIQYVQPPVGAEGLRTKVKEGDFLFSITGYLGMFAIAPSIGDSYVNQHISLARPLDGFSKKYFGYYVTSHTGGIHYLNKQTKGAVKAGLGLDDIQNFPVPICSLNEQIQISSELESRLSETDQLDQTITTALQQAEALRQSILKKAFSGQLVPQDPNDEPASELLARIRAERADNGSRNTNQRRTKKVFA